MNLTLLAPTFGWNLVLFFAGLSIGSFLSVIVQRSLAGKSWVRGRSQCDHCKKVILWYDNIPLVSFFLLRGRCRFCRQPIAFFHPLLEFLTGIGFVLTSWFSFGGLPPASFTQAAILVFWLLVFTVSWLIFWFDWQAMIIPDLLVIVLGGLALLRLGWLYLFHFLSPTQLLTTLAATVGLSLFFLSLWLITKRQGFGLGDVKLAIPLGLLLGFPQLIIGVFSAFIIGAVWGIILIISGRKKFGQVVPFGPFLIVGLWLALAWGQKLWLTYWQILY
ncbi:MAG: hypothetical protein GF381_01310 [Candidatus Pacebacteria bacterium]|nr:hypothetical protein [Candidatus Paceibacterota bacterium]